MPRDDRSVFDFLGRSAGAALGSLPGIAGGMAHDWAEARRPTVGRLARGALAGVAAAGALWAFRTLLARSEPAEEPVAREIADELLAGAGRGVVYAALLDPFLPGPPLVRGALAGTVDYFAAPHGGLFSRLQALSPVRNVPVLSILLETGDAEDDSFLTFVLHGALLGLLYGEVMRED